MGNLPHYHVIRFIAWLVVFPSILIIGTTIFALTAFQQYVKQIIPLPMAVWDDLGERLASVLKGD